MKNSGATGSGAPQPQKSNKAYLFQKAAPVNQGIRKSATVAQSPGFLQKKTQSKV